MEDFERQANQKRTSLLPEILSFLGENKKWWLVPILAVVLLFGALLVLASSSAAAPFIYTLF